MRLLARLLEPKVTVYAHCDLPCGVYDPAQARIEAESVRAICEKYQQNEDPAFRTRALQIKEERSDLVKHHLWVLWTDYFKPPHFEKYQGNDDPAFRARAIQIKEERSDLVKHHLWVLWTDYFKPPHFAKYPQLHELFNEATKLAGAGGTKGSTDVATADKLLAKIDEISKLFWATKQG